MGIEKRLISDFEDYYDKTYEIESIKRGIEEKPYIRYMNRLGKWESLNWLKNNCIETIDSGTVLKIEEKLNSDRITNISKLNNENKNKKLLVYVNPYRHEGEGKVVIPIKEALQTYPNYYATEYLEDEGEIIHKYIQIGRLRYAVLIKYKKNLKIDKVLNIIKLERGYNRLNNLPIFSIDYLHIKNKLVAIDFNTGQRLSTLGFNKILKEKDVVEEINFILNRGIK